MLKHFPRPRITYANVTATLALFMALGGSAYAIARLNGHQIKNHSIPVIKLVRGAVVPRARLAKRVSHLLISSGRHHHHRGRAADQGAGASSTVVVLSVGQSAQLFQSGPFTITAHCTDAGGGKDKISIDGTATVDWLSGETRYSAGETQTLYYNVDSQPDAFTNNGVGMVAADGESLTLQNFTTTQHFLGDCSFSGSAVG